MSVSGRIPVIYPNLKKGDRLYAVITYRTPNVFINPYLPKPYFILEVIIEQVSEGSGGGLYFFDTNFYLDAAPVFLEPDRAKNVLVQIFNDETDGILTRDKVTLLSLQKYKEMSQKAQLERNSRVA